MVKGAANRKNVYIKSAGSRDISMNEKQIAFDHF